MNSAEFSTKMEAKAKADSARKKAWKLKNADHVKAESQRYYATNRESILAYHIERHQSPEWKEYKLAHNAARQKKLRQNMPAWADQNRILQIYRGCPDGFHVDHIVPLRGKTVSGLHVPENLQYLPAVDNMKKGNKFDSSSIVPSESILQSAL